MSSVVFESAIPASELSHTYALDPAATGIRRHNLLLLQNKYFNNLLLEILLFFPAGN